MKSTCKLLGLGFGAVALCATALPAAAASFTQPGATTGSPNGFNAPPGFYFGNAANYGIGQNLTVLPDVGQTTAVGVEAPFFIWSPGWNFLGPNISYAASITGVFVDVGVRVPGHGAGNLGPVIGGVNADLYLRSPFNPLINPLALSWNIGNGFAASFAEFIYIPINAETTIDSAGGTVRSPASFEQRVAVSYIGNDWIASANAIFGLVTTNALGVSGPDYLNVDLTLGHTFGHWSIGVVGYGAWDINQTPINTNVFGGFSPNEEIGFGGYLGYDFGVVNMQLKLTHEFITNGVDSNYGRHDTRIWSVFVIPIWNPPPPAPPHPVIAKY
jgi:hypothetical protein